MNYNMYSEKWSGNLPKHANRLEGSRIGLNTLKFSPRGAYYRHLCALMIQQKQLGTQAVIICNQQLFYAQKL